MVSDNAGILKVNVFASSLDEDDFGDIISTPADLEESEDYIFYGWKSITTGEYLTDNKAVQSDVYYPVYDFAATAEIPQANIPSGEYTSNQTVELSCTPTVSLRTN